MVSLGTRQSYASAEVFQGVTICTKGKDSSSQLSTMPGAHTGAGFTMCPLVSVWLHSFQSEARSQILFVLYHLF